MSQPDFYSDRINGAVPRTRDVLPEHTSKALVSLVGTKVASHWLARSFPEKCQDGGSTAGTDVAALSHNLQGLIPGIEWPLWQNNEWADATVFDLIEYAASRVALPVEGQWHSYWSHYELSFKEHEGRREFVAEVNQLLARGGTMFQLSGGLQIERIGTPAVQEIYRELRSNSGDQDLDNLLSEALVRYRSRQDSDRALALEKLWDAFERLKTLDIPGGDKKASIAALLAHLPDAGARELVESDMTALTNVGNQFMIRHHETGKKPVAGQMRDYLFARLGSLIVLLLRESGRL